MPTEKDYITSPIPPEMAEDGIMEEEIPGFTVSNEPGLTRVRVPPPAFAIPLPSPSAAPISTLTSGAAPLIYDFALLPDVQFHGELRGPATARHLKQLIAYLQVACVEMERAGRGKRKTKSKISEP